MSSVSSTSSTSSASSTSSRSSASESRSNSSSTASSIQEARSFRDSQDSTDSVPLPRERPDRVDVDFNGATEAESPRVGALLSAMTEQTQDEDLTPGERLAETAEEWVDKEFKPGETARCADFVSQMVLDSGIDAPDFEATVRARDFAEMGELISAENLAEGDVVAFNNTYRHSSSETDHTHVGIYIGDGMMVHRPTSDAPVELVSLEEYLARPTAEGLPDRTLFGGYRLTEE